MSLSLEEFRKLIDRLKDSLARPKDEFMRDSVIQRFEFTIELAWKVARKSMGSNTQSPKSVIRELSQDGIISDPNVWFDLIEARNMSSHTYHEDLAEKVYNIAKNSISEIEALYQKLYERK